MKNVLILLFCFVLLLFIVQISYAQEDSTDSAKESSMSAEVNNYQLPYAGLLPDNPLYFLKGIRDRVVWFLITDPLKKAEFDVLQADKHLDAAQTLLKKGKPKLAESTISKGENYFEEAITKVKEAQKAGEESNGLILRLSLSVAKHEDVLEELDKSEPLIFDTDFQRITKFKKQVSTLKPK